MNPVQILSLIIICFFASCSSDYSKNKYLEDFGSFINKVELESESYSEEDWKYIAVEFNDYAEIQYMSFEDKLTESEITQVESYKDRYDKLTVKNDLGGGLLKIIGLE